MPPISLLTPSLEFSLLGEAPYRLWDHGVGNMRGHLAVLMGCAWGTEGETEAT